MSTKANDIINELDPTKFKCPVCLKAANKLSAIRVITDDVICLTCGRLWINYCTKVVPTINECNGPCSECYIKWKTIRKKQMT